LRPAVHDQPPSRHFAVRAPVLPAPVAIIGAIGLAVVVAGGALAQSPAPGPGDSTARPPAIALAPPYDTEENLLARLRRDPRDTRAAVAYANLLEVGGEPDRARAVLERYFAENPDVSLAWKALRRLYADLARAAYARSLNIPVASVPPLAMVTRDDAAAAADPSRQGAGAGASGCAVDCPGVAQPAADAARAPSTVPAPAAVAPAASAPRTPPPAAVATAPRPSTAAREAGVVAEPLAAGAPPPAAAGPRTGVLEPASVPAAAEVASIRIGAMQAPVAPSQPPPPDTKADDVLRAQTLAWAKAWAGKDMEAYLGSYAAEFKGPTARTREEWVEQRRRAVDRNQDIRITLEGLAVRQVSDSRAEVSFLQVYRAVGIAMETRKTLTWDNNGTRWSIVAETSSGERRAR